MKKIILFALTALIMVGCDTGPSHCRSFYFGDKWDLLKVNDSIYIMFPKYEEYHEPCTLKIKDKNK